MHAAPGTLVVTRRPEANDAWRRICGRTREPMQFTLLELWSHMGAFAKIIVLVMAAMSMASVVVMAERLMFYKKSQRASARFAAEVARVIESGQLAVPDAGVEGPGHLGRVLAAGLNAYKMLERAPADLAIESV